MSYTKALGDLVGMLKKWGLKPDDFILTGRLTLFILGYKPKRKLSSNIVVLFNKEKLPWFDKTCLYETFPPRGSDYLRDYKKFIKINFYFQTHFYVENNNRFKRILRKTMPLDLKNCKINITKPLGYVYFFNKLISLYRDYELGEERTRRRLKIHLPKLIKIAKIKNNQKLLEKVEEISRKYSFLTKKRERVKNEKDIFLKNKIIKGLKVYGGEVKGEVKVIDHDVISTFPQNKILVTRSTAPRTLLFLEKIKAIITDEGGICSHASIMAREFKIPCIIKAKIATKVLKNGDLVEVNANEGIIKKLN
jgi:phosphohistidine swiveling domain-containing protein